MSSAEQLAATTEDDLKPSTCIACRLRRKRCDRKMPICTSCEELNISEHLCVCPQNKLGLKSKNSKITLDELKSRNDSLKEEEGYLKSLLNGELPEPDVRMKLSQILNSEQKVKKRERNLFLTVTSGLYSCSAHFGSTSWQALLASNPEYSQFLYQIAAVLSHARLEYDRTKHALQGTAKGDPRLNSIRSRIIEGCLGLVDHVDLNQIGLDLMREIEESLPPYDTLLGLFHSYFMFNRYRNLGFPKTDEEEFYNEFHHIISKDANGMVKINISLPGEETKTTFLYLLLTMVTFITFIANHSYGSSTSYNHLLIHELADVLFYYSIALIEAVEKRSTSFVHYNEHEFKFSVHLIQGILHFKVFERYTPHGRLIEIDDATMGHSLSVKMANSIIKGSNFYKNIDTVFKDKSLSYKHSLKGFCFFAAFLDACEAIEVGVLPKINLEDFDLNEENRNKYTETVLLLNKTMNKYFLKESKDSMEIVDYVTKDLVPSLKAFLNKNSMPIGDIIRQLNELNLEDTSNVSTFYELSECFLIQITFLSLIQVLYTVCSKRLEENHRFSPPHKRFNLLSLKYGLLMFYSVPAYLQCHQRISSHKNGAAFGTLPALLSLFPHLRYAFRRAALAVGIRAFEYLPVDKRTLFNSIYHKHAKSDDEILQEILAKENFQPFFSFQDLEDFDIDDNQEELLGKFSVLNNYRYLILSLGKAVVDLQNCLRSEYISLSFIRLNPSFFRILKTCSIFLNAAYSDIQEAPTNVNPTVAGQNIPFQQQIPEQFDSNLNLNSKTSYNNGAGSPLQEHEHQQQQQQQQQSRASGENDGADPTNFFLDSFARPQSELLDFAWFFNTPGLYHTGNVDELLSFVPNEKPYDEQ